MEAPVEEQSISPLQIRALLYIIKKHKWKIVTLFLSTVITVAIGSLLATPIYQASAQLLVKPGREDIYVSPTGRSVINYATGQGQKVNAEIAIITSLGLVEEVVDWVGVNTLFDYPDRTLKGKISKGSSKQEIPPIQEVYKILVKNLDVSAVPKSNVIRVTFSWPDPVIAARVVNTLIDLYFVQHLKVHTNPGTYDLLEEQANKWEKELRLSENDLETFKRSHNITSLSQQRTMLLGRLSEAKSQKKRTESEIQENLGMMATLESQLSHQQQNVQLQETVNKNSETVAALKARLVELELQGLREEIERVKKMIAEEEKKERRVVVSGKSPIRQNLESDLLRAKARLAALKAKRRNQKMQIDTYKEQLVTLDGFEKQLKELTRKVSISEANYNLYLSKFEEARISENMDKQKIANVSVIEPAVPIMEPVKPKKRLNVLIGGFLALFAGIGIAFLIEFINPVFHTREDVQQFLGLPVIATLPIEQLAELEGNSKKAGRRVLLLVTSLILIILLGFTLWYFEVHKNAEHLENQATKPELPLSNLEKLEKSFVELGRSRQMQFVTQAQASPIQTIKRTKIVSQIPRPIGGEG